MSYLRYHPLGQTIPASVHAVCASLPTMADVVGYEEKHPEIMAKVRYGYPRFVFHEYVLRAAAAVAASRGWEGRAVYAVCSRPAAEQLLAYVGCEAAGIAEVADFVAVHCQDGPEVRERAKAFLQHTGVSISSRHAEDYLITCGLLEGAQDEVLFAGDEELETVRELRRYVPTEFLWPTNCGMNAFYSAIQAVRRLQAGRGRHVYLQLGWLYLDTQRVLEKLLGEGDRLIVLHDVFDRKALEQVFSEHGERLAAVVTELPTNPLMQTLDVEHLSRLCLRHGVARIFDPSMAGIVNVDILPHCDVLVSSLTKYAAWEGDVMCGLAALNPESPMAADLADVLGASVEKPYVRDLRRLARQLGRMGEVADRVNANTARLVTYLEQHPSVARVHHALSASSARHFRTIARTPQSTGGMITFELKGELAAFYDKARVVKGPSFGTHFTMMCPFLYLAHYDLVSSQEGRAYLNGLGLNPELIRLSVGTESWDTLVGALALS